jgi:hypothetical protein
MAWCLSVLLVAVGGVCVVLSLLRWFEQTAEAVDTRDWRKLAVLVICPPATWAYRSRVVAGRPTAVPRHTPVRGFGLEPTVTASPPPSDDGPPPGTPPEFLGPPVVPPPTPKRGVEPEQLEKLRRKMREQGLLPPEE